MNDLKLVSLCTWPFYAYAKGCTNIYHSLWCSVTICNRRAIIALLKRSAFLFVRRWYDIVVKCFVPEKAHRDSKNLLLYCVLLSVKAYSGIPYGVTQLSISNDAICEAVVLEWGTALVSFVYRFVIICRNWLPLNIFRSGARMPIAVESNGFLDGNICRGPRHFSDVLLRTHSLQSLKLV